MAERSSGCWEHFGALGGAGRDVTPDPFAYLATLARAEREVAR
jgi:hypothetical protein